MEPAGPPRSPVAVPAAVMRAAAGDPARAIWRNGLGGLTFEVTGGEHRFVKWAPTGSGLDLAAESIRLRWVAPWIRVPEVLDEGSDPEGTWLMTRAIPGRSAVDDRWRAEPESAVRAVGAGLRALHESIPVAGCPFDWSVTERLDRAFRAGIVVPEELRIPPPVDGPVVCHGDACAPNTLLSDDGRVAGYVDLGTLGVGDRWGDLAAAALSTGWNYGPGWEDALLDAYGIAPDEERLRYYRELWMAT